MNETQREIILKLIHTLKATFTELSQGAKDSNRFAYHIKTLVDQGLINHEGEYYNLSLKGHQLSSFIEGATGDIAKFPTFSNGLIVEKDGKFLFQKRLKKPFYGIWGLISGKINFGWNVVECALRDLEEETGLIAKTGKEIGFYQAKTFENGKLAFHHMFFLIRLSGISGELIEKTHKAENAWLTLEEFFSKDTFPCEWLRDVVNVKDRFIFLEAERFSVNDKFTEFKLTRNELI